ncbi:MAG: hypothetical protein K5917_06270 [Clostridiales bacterium]|nr:hypothetical protein [Clostridiales bacterium]
MKNKVKVIAVFLVVTLLALSVTAFADDGGAPQWNDGAVYFVWADGDGEENNFYYHKITQVVGGGEMNYVPVSTITYDNDNTIKYDIKNRTRTAHYQNGTTSESNSYEFVWMSGFEAIKDTNEFLNLTTTEKFEYLFENDLTVNPIAAINGANCISTMGDLAFKLTIYNDAVGTYQGVSIGVPSTYEYFPAFWDQVFHWNVVDISETTKENPAVFDAFLLEKTLRIGKTAASRPIVSVTPLDVPEKAVTISSAGDFGWDITYNSNYYDEVEFELRDNAGNSYYIVLQRTNVKLKNLMGDTTRAVYAAVYYPQNESYENYSVFLKINYKDGKTQTKIISAPVKGIEGENGDFIDAYETDGGENLKQCWYKLDGITHDRNSNVESFYITIIKKSATTETFGGTLAGSGDGIQFKDSGKGFKRVLGGSN